MESMGIYKNESMAIKAWYFLVTILLSILSRKHGKHGKIALERMGMHGIYANEFIPLWFPGSSWLSLRLLAP